MAEEKKTSPSSSSKKTSTPKKKTTSSSATNTAKKTVKKTVDKKADSFIDSALGNIKTKDGKSVTENKTVKKLLKSVSTVAKIIAIVLFFVGAVLGAFVGKTICGNDTFEIIGASPIITMDETDTDGYDVAIDSVKVIAYGKDVSNKVTEEYSEGLTKNADGTYHIKDITVAGVYYIIYHPTDMKYKKIQKIRYITVQDPNDQGDVGEVD